jgi:hypothetical protein
MTVASIRERPGADSIRVAFLESARFYELPRSHPEFDRIVACLRESRIVKIQLASIESGVIEDVL